MRLVCASILLVMAAAVSGTAEIIDRVAVSLENTVIPLSEVLRQIRITALLNNEVPDFSKESRREAAERLVQQYLIRREINISRYIPQNTAQAEILYKAFRVRYKSEDEYHKALSRYNLTDAEVRAAFNWQATFLDFVEVRFRPGITIPEDELKAVYDEKYKGKSADSFDDLRPKIEEELMQQRVDNALDRWLGQATTQTRIVYREDALK